MRIRKIFFFILMLIADNQLLAQDTKPSLLYNLVQKEKNQGAIFTNGNYFSRVEKRILPDDSLLAIPGAVIMVANDESLTELHNNKPDGLTLTIPVSADNKITLQLVRQEINSTDSYQFGIIQQDGDRKVVNHSKGIHYRGYIDGEQNSLASLSIFSNGEVMGMFCNQNGNYVMGKIKNRDEYIIYNSKDLHLPVNPTCGTNDWEHVKYSVDKDLENRPTAPSNLCNKVSVYWEVDYGFYYNAVSNLTIVQNYMNGLFNQVAAVYQNEGITIELSELYVWTVPDPYRTSSRANALEDFRVRWNKLNDKFNGDIAMLISKGPNNLGGVGYIDVLCTRFYAYAYSQVYGYISNYPSFSSDVYLVAHEMGHNLGSKHTQWCGWNTGSGGACGAIDNCYPVEAEGACTTCPSTIKLSSLPAGWTGTIMSYCHLVNGVGINFVNGFGPLPQAIIRNRVAASSCLLTNNLWTGAVDSLWSNAANWSCGSVPTANTDVTIQTPATNFPVIKSAAICRKLTELQGAKIKVNRLFSLTLTGNNPAEPLVKLPSSGKLYITGNATPGGFMQPGAPELLSQKLIQVTPTLYEIPSITLTANSSFLFVAEYGVFSNAQVYGFAGDGMTNNTSGDQFKLGGSFIKSPAVTGKYHILVDFKRGLFSIYDALDKVMPPTTNELYITGSATPANWMSVGQSPVLSQKFTRISNTEYELSSITLNGGGSFLLVPVYGNWDKKYGGIGSNNNYNTPLGDMICTQGSDLLAPPTTGNYKINVNFHTGTYKLTKL